MTDEEQEIIKQREKEKKKRANADKEYDHPDDKPMGRDPLGRDERKVSGRSWSESPLKLESELERLDVFLNKSKSNKPPPGKKIITEQSENKDLKSELESLISENTEEISKKEKT